MRWKRQAKNSRTRFTRTRPAVTSSIASTRRLRRSRARRCTIFWPATSGSSLHPFSRANHEMHRAADEAEGVAKLVFQVAAIGKVQRLVGIREEGDGRRPGFQLCGVVEASWPATKRRRLMLGERALQDLIQLGSAETLAIAGDDLIDPRKNLLHAPAGFR